HYRSDQESRCDLQRAYPPATALLRLCRKRPSRHRGIETELPAQRSLKEFVERLLIFRLNKPQCHQHHRCVVRVRIINIVVLERPAAGFWIRIAHRPITTNAYFLADEPIGGFPECGIFW